MKNHYAVKLNTRLGIVLFDENDTKYIKLLKFNKKQIKAMMIDDLINPDTKLPTARLQSIMKEILWA
jgi:hypothetical protein